MAENILFVHQSSEMYGSDKVLYYLVTELLKRENYHPIVVLPGKGPLHDALLTSGIEVYIGEVAKLSRDMMRPIGLFRMLVSIFRGISQLDNIVAKRSVLLVHSNTLAVFSGALWALFRGVKHIWHVHEIILSPKFARRLFPYITRLLSHAVISNSSLTEKWLLEEQPRLKPRSVVVFNGLPRVEMPDSKRVAEFRKFVKASPSDVVIILAGRINRWKGQQLLVQAALLLHQQGLIDSVRFAFVGSPAPGLETLLAELEQDVSNQGLDDYFHFIPFVDDIWPIWFGSDICVVPSTEPEPFGMVAIEAMAAGIPVIAAGHGGLLDIVEDRHTGLLFTPGDAESLASSIAKLLRERQLRRSMGAAGALRQQERFSLTAQVKLTEAIYDVIRQDGVRR